MFLFFFVNGYVFCGDFLKGSVNNNIDLESISSEEVNEKVDIDGFSNNKLFFFEGNFRVENFFVIDVIDNVI